MLPRRLSRTAMLFGAEKVGRLTSACAAVFGLGGVGAAAAEALARSGVGKLVLVDGDHVEESNLNRQLFALRSTLGLFKTEAASRRIKDIAPECELSLHPVFYLPQSVESEQNDLLLGVDVVIDAIDTVTAKLALFEACRARGIPLLSCMGTGNRADPSQLRLGDVFETQNDPLCRVMRRELRKRGAQHLRCVYSKEPPRKPDDACLAPGDLKNGRTPPSSAAFVPPAAGLLLASAAVRILTGELEP